MVTSLGVLLSFVFTDPDTAVLIGAIMAVLLNVFSGFVPLLGGGTWMYTHYAARALCTIELWFEQVLDTEDTSPKIQTPFISGICTLTFPF